MIQLQVKKNLLVPLPYSVSSSQQLYTELFSLSFIITLIPLSQPLHQSLTLCFPTKILMHSFSLEIFHTPNSNMR